MRSPPWWLLAVEWATVDEYGMWRCGIILAACIIAIRIKRGDPARTEVLLGLGYLAATVLSPRIGSGIPLITSLAPARRKIRTLPPADYRPPTTVSRRETTKPQRRTKTPIATARFRPNMPVQRHREDPKAERESVTVPGPSPLS